MTDWEPDETEKKILLLLEMIQREDVKSMGDQNAIGFMYYAMKVVGLRFLNYIATPKEKGVDDG